MIALLALGAALWLGGAGFTLALCRAASKAPPSSGSPDCDCLEDVKQPVADTTGLINPATARAG